MLKSAVASRRSIEDMEEGVPMPLLPCPGKQDPLMQEYPTSSTADAAPKTDRGDDRDQHPLEAVDENTLTRGQGAEAERQESVQPSLTNGKDCFISTLYMLKELIEEEKRSLKSADWQRCEVIKFMVNILEELEQDTVNPSTAVDKNRIHEEKVKFVATQWDKLSPYDKMRMRTILFVVLSELQRATTTNWGPEENQHPVAYVCEIVQKLLVFVRTTRSHLKSILHLQRDVANVMWGFNHLDECSKSVKTQEALFEKLMKLNHFLLSSSIEQMVVLWPSLEYYAQGRGSNPVLLSRGNSKVGFQTLTNVYKSRLHPYLNVSGIKWLHFALYEMQLEQKQWADIVSSRMRFRNGGDSTNMGNESIGRIIEKAMKATSCLLGFGTDPGKMYEDDGDETCSMFFIEYLDVEKFRNTDDIILDINLLVSINRLLLRLRCSLDKLVEDYVWASKREEDAEHDQDICVWYFVYEYRYIFEEEDAKPYGTSLTELDNIPYADDAIGVTECNAAVNIFLDKFMRQIHYTKDNSFLQHGNAGFQLENLRDHALSMEHERKKYLEVNKMEEALKSRLLAAYGATSPGACSWGRRLLMPTDALLFGIEREALRKIVSSPEHNVLENMDRVAAPKWMYGVWHLEDVLLKESIIRLSRRDIPKPRAQGKDVLLLMLFPVLYLLDIATDINVAHKHWSQANYQYFGLTLVFIFGPMLAEFIMKIFLKLRNSSFPWKWVFSLASLTVLPRALRSVMFGINSRRQFDQDLCVFYEELNRARGGLPEEFLENLRRSKISLINAHSFAAMVENEGLQLHWKIHEAMNESAPQLLLQSVIVIIQLGNGETVGLLTYIGILVSLASFSWTLHLFHYLFHYDGLVNKLKLINRATDFLVYFLIVGCRFIALSMVMAQYPVWFCVASLMYLGLRFLYLYYFSSDRKDYRGLTGLTNNPLWMVYRLYITPYMMNIWSMNRYDDLIFHFETFALTLSWPFLLDGRHPLAEFRWIIPATILILNFIILPLILKINGTMFEESTICGNHDPFLLRKRLWKDLKAGKTRVERSFGRGTSKSTSSYKYRVECPIVGVPPVVGTL